MRKEQRVMNRFVCCFCALMVILILAGGCSIRHGDFTVISNKMVRLSDFNLGEAETNKDITGEDIQHIIIFIPTSGPPTLEGAMDDALRKGNGDVMTDAVVEWWTWYIPYIYGQTGWRVRGDVARTR